MTIKYDGIFSYLQSQFGYILESIVTKYAGVVYVHLEYLVYFITIWHIKR
jgi:hypothetical protein